MPTTRFPDARSSRAEPCATWSATRLGVYGVSGLRSHGPFGEVIDRLGIGARGSACRSDRELAIDLHLIVAYGLPVAEVARQVDATVRYAVRHAIGREPDRVSIHVEGLRFEPGAAAAGARRAIRRATRAGRPRRQRHGRRLMAPKPATARGS